MRAATRLLRRRPAPKHVRQAAAIKTFDDQFDYLREILNSRVYDAAVETPITRSQSVGAPPRSASTGTPGCRPTHHPGADSTGCRRSSNRESSRDSNQQVRFEYHVVPQPDTVDAALRAADAAEERRPPRYHQKGRRRPTPRRPPTESDTSSPLDA